MKEKRRSLVHFDETERRQMCSNAFHRRYSADIR